MTRAGRPRRAPAVPEALPRLLAGWNAHDPASVATAFSPDGVRHQFSMPEFRFVGRYAIAVGVDAIHCSSGGIGGAATNSRLPRGPGFQVPFAERISTGSGPNAT